MPFVTIQYSKDILKKHNWLSMRQLMAYLDSIDETLWAPMGTIEKTEFTNQVKSQIDEVEGYGATLASIRETMGMEYIRMYYPSDYGYLMAGYKKERKKLKQMLQTAEALRTKK